jgi:hypothetical protein
MLISFSKRLAAPRCRHRPSPRPLGGDFGQHFLQLLDFLDAALLGEPLAHAIERVGEARRLDRLHQIIHRLRLEGADGVVE